MHNFTGKHPHVIENVDCRCKIYIGSILTSQKRQDIDAIMRDRQAEKYLHVQQKTSCRYFGSKKEHPQRRILRRCRYIGCYKGICNSKYPRYVDTPETRKVNPPLIHFFQPRYTRKILHFYSLNLDNVL